MSSGAFNPLLVPVKFVKAAGDGLGTVGGEDEHGLELAGAASPPLPARERRLPRHSVEGALADEVGNLDLDADAANDDLAPPPPETAFEPEPASTATMALDELEDAPDSAEPAAHPGLGSRAREPVERDPPRAAVAASPAPSAADDDDGDGDDGPPLFEISTTASAVTVDVPASIAPPVAFASHDPSTPLSSDESDSDSEQILFPRRAQAHADPVSSARAPPAVPRPAADLSLLASTSTPAPAAPAARARTTHPSQPAQPAKQSKKALKRASRAARKTGRAHPRSGNAHLAGHGPGRTLADSDDEDDEDGEASALRESKAQDREDGAALFARMQGGGAEGVDDMLVADSEDDEFESVDAQGHVPGQPRQGDSDIEWGSSSPPPVGPAGARGRAKKAAQRAQRADQRERDKLERLVAAGQTRDEVELALALEVSAREADDERRRAARERERRRAEDDYLANVDDEGDDSMAVLAAFAKGAVGQLGGEHGRGDDADRRMAEDDEDEDEWGTSSEGGSSSSASEEDDEDTEGAQDRRLAHEEDDSEELDSDVELEMEYSLGDADGRCVASSSRRRRCRQPQADFHGLLAVSSTRSRSTRPTTTRPSTRPSPRRPTRTPSCTPSSRRSSPARRSRCSAWAKPARAGARTSASARRRARASARARARRTSSTAAAATATATATRSCSPATTRGPTVTRTTSRRCRCVCSLFLSLQLPPGCTS